MVDQSFVNLWPLKGPVFKRQVRKLLRRGVLGDSLSTFGEGVLGKLSGEEESTSSLDLPGGDRRLFVDLGEAGSFTTDTVKDVAHERIHDRHGFGGDSLVGVDLLQHLVDVGLEGLLSGLSVLAGGGGGGLGGSFGHFGVFDFFSIVGLWNSESNAALYTDCWEGPAYAPLESFWRRFVFLSALSRDSARWSLLFFSFL